MHPGIGAVPAHSTGHSAQQWKQSSDGIWEETWHFKVLEKDIFLDQDLKGLAASRLFSGCFGNIVARHHQCHIAWIYLTKRAKPLSRKYQWHWICHIKETINYLMSCLWGVQKDKQGDSFFIDLGHKAPICLYGHFDSGRRWSDKLVSDIASSSSASNVARTLIWI